MQKYVLNMETGKLCGQNEEVHADKASIWLMKLEEFKQLDGNLPHRRSLYRSMCPVQCCKVETFEECIQGTMRVPREGGGKLSFHTFGFHMEEDGIIFIEDGDLVKIQLGKMEHDSYGACTITQFLLLLFEMLIEDDVLYLQQQEDKLADVEEGLLKKIPEHFYEGIIRYRKCLSAHHSYYEQLMNIGDLMQSETVQSFLSKERVGWQLYANRAERLHNHVELLREYLVQIRDLYQSLIDLQQNKVISILTVVTTIFLPLTLIAGWYGMNFSNMPELHWKYGYLAVILASALIISLEILYFKKKKML